MKHIKLFEQVGEWEDLYGEDSYPDDYLKAGDKVRILNNDGGANLKIGSIGIIESEYDNNRYFMVIGKNKEGFPGKRNIWSYKRNQLRKI